MNRLICTRCRSSRSYRGACYSVPHTHRHTHVWVRTSGDEVIIVANSDSTNGGGAVEIARHPKLASGQASIVDEHYPPRRDPVGAQPRAANDHEAAFLAIGDGARTWLIEAAGIGARRIRALMQEALDLAGTYDIDEVDQALGQAPVNHRFDPGDIEPILCRHRIQPRRASGAHSLQNPTAVWSALGAPVDGGEGT